LSDEIIRLVADSEKFCRHFHIPLQSVLRQDIEVNAAPLYTGSFTERNTAYKRLMPGAGIGVRLIVGFPGETDEDFRESYEFITSLDISYLHVFTYSERPDTKAAIMAERVPVEKRKERNAMLSYTFGKKEKILLPVTRSAGKLRYYLKAVLPQNPRIRA